MQKFLIATATAVAMTAGAAQAASYTVMDSVPLSSTEIGGTLSVAKFNAALGTLTSVSYTVITDVESTITLTNNGANPETLSASTNVDFTLSGFDPAAWDLALFGDAALDVNASTGSQTLAAGETGVFPVSDSSAFSGTIPGDFTGTLADWTGPGFASFLYETVTAITITGGGGNIVAAQTTQAAISLEVTYNYQTADIPLPAAFPLLASAFGVFGVMRLRRSRKS